MVGQKRSLPARRIPVTLKHLKNRSLLTIASLVASCAMIAAAAETAMGDAPPMPAAPKVSTFAPAEDLASQVDQYINELEKMVASEEEYKDSEGKLANNSNTLMVVALALGLHDQDSKYKASAGTLIEAAQELAAAQDYASAKKGVAALRKAAESKDAGGGELQWQKIASLPALMKEVPMINTKLKRLVKGANFQKKAKDTAGYTAVIATIAQSSMADLSETKDADQVKQWYGFSAAMRDHAGAVNAAIHKADEPAAAEAMKKLAQSCDDCHDVFHKEKK
jgi:hypothetical protein